MGARNLVLAFARPEYGRHAYYRLNDLRPRIDGFGFGFGYGVSFYVSSPFSKNVESIPRLYYERYFCHGTALFYMPLTSC